MKGYQIVLFEGAEYDPDFRKPVRADTIRKWWEPNYKRAQTRLTRVQTEYDGIAEIR